MAASRSLALLLLSLLLVIKTSGSEHQIVETSKDNVENTREMAKHLAEDGDRMKGWREDPLGPSLRLSQDQVAKIGGDGLEDELCRNYTTLYLAELKRFTLWAVQMYDSTAKVPEGILTGNTYQLGSYDGCLSIEVPMGKSLESGFGGKYCLAKVQFAPMLEVYPAFFAPSEDPYRMDFAANESAWEKIKYTGNRRRMRRDVVHWGVCVPSVCSAQNVASALKLALQPLENRLGVRTSISLPENMCTSTAEQAFSLDSIDIGYGAVVVVVVCIVLICTAIETLKHYRSLQTLEPVTEGSIASQIVQCFSIRANWIGLGRGPAARDADTGDLRSIHGIRFCSMVLIILGHRCMFSFGGPLHNPEKVEQIFTSAANMLLLNGPIIVDNFFVISGFLTCYLMLLELDKKRSINFGLLYVYRYIRLTPVYAAVVGFYATYLAKLGEGPLWESEVGLERERCRANWWANLLYINNYFNTEQLCLLQSWFLASDTHYFILAPLLVYALWRHPRIGKILLGVTGLIAVIAPFAVTLFGGLDAVLLLFMSTLADPVANDTFRNIYIPSHTRAGPYVVGMFMGFLLYRIRTEAIKVSKRTGVFLWISLHLVAFASCFGAWAFYVTGGRDPSAVERALYGGLHRTGWGIATGWLIVASALDLSGPYRAILSWKPLVPFSRLTYCAFLVHAGVQLFGTATLRNPEYMSYYKLFWMTCGDVIVTFGIALVLYMLFEAPVCELQRTFLKRGKRPADSVPISVARLPSPNSSDSVVIPIDNIRIN